ncbi:hypothetical protein [Marinobacterium jannaschii]|uniref:hypothetical protein n=1 Tax=Marinobacterium jannaschii TaxID=64970 RepID=UPI000685FB32|nr:hypothetical protein [Marinobacterium jannaschii]
MKRTEDQIILEYTNSLLRETRWTIEDFGTDRLTPALREGLIDVDPADPYSIHSEAAAYLRWKNKIGVQLGRIMRGTTKFPLSWKWAWVTSLPEPYQTQCRQELLALAGVMDIPLPVIEIAERRPARARIADFMRESADLLAAAAPADDGFYDESDDPEAVDRMADEMIDVIEVLERELQAIGRGTGRTGRRRTVIEKTVIVRSEIDG